MQSDGLVFCDCGFHSVCPLMEKDKRLMEASWWDRLTVGETGSCSGRTMLSKPFNQFSVDGQSCVPSLFLTWGQTLVEVMKIMGTFFKRSHACSAALSAPDPAAGHRWPMPPPETPGHSWAIWSVSCGVTSPFFWVLVNTRFCCALEELVSPVLCKFWWL